LVDTKARPPPDLPAVASVRRPLVFVLGWRRPDWRCDHSRGQPQISSAAIRARRPAIRTV